jgi:hypothetical protein
LIAQGHSYLHSLVPWTIFALGVGASMFLRRAALAARPGSHSGSFTRLSAAALWAVTTVSLIAIYSVQETLESFSLSGHPAGVAGVVGHRRLVGACLGGRRPPRRCSGWRAGRAPRVAPRLLRPVHASRAYGCRARSRSSHRRRSRSRLRARASSHLGF